MCISKNDNECIHLTIKEDKKIFIEEQVEIQKAVGSSKKCFPLQLVPGSLCLAECVLQESQNAQESLVS